MKKIILLVAILIQSCTPKKEYNSSDHFIAQEDIIDSLKGKVFLSDSLKKIMYPNDSSNKKIFIRKNDFNFSEINLDINNFKYQDLIKLLDTVEYIGFNDLGYKIFNNIYSYKQADSIVKHTVDSKIMTYAIYKLLLESNHLSEKQAIELLLYLSKEKKIKAAIWINPFTKGEYYLHQIAVDAIWTAKTFEFTDEQEHIIKHLRRF
ncbi:hypothetical protein [Bernardetia sp. MNP-M8]|uniref:hypothetical protein n=1 Tax=Bernardetia sp. MNP-M8 TaxID=3127470 RepID=UPI0030D1DCBB